MPSEQQLHSAMREKADLEKELQSLTEAADPVESAHRIMQFIERQEEGLTAEDNHWIQDKPVCDHLHSIHCHFSPFQMKNEHPPTWDLWDLRSNSLALSPLTLSDSQCSL